MKNTNRDAIESLRSFAVANSELAFAHLCTAALDGEEWAVERMAGPVAEVIDASWTRRGHYRSAAVRQAATLRVIRSTDTARPDGAIAAQEG